MVAVMSPSATPNASMNVGAPWCLRLTTLTTREHSPDRLALAQDSLRHSQELPSRDPSPKLPPYFFLLLPAIGILGVNDFARSRHSEPLSSGDLSRDRCWDHGSLRSLRATEGSSSIFF